MRTAAKMLVTSLTGLGMILVEVMSAAHRSDLPSLQNQDPSGEFGDEGLPRLRLVALGDSSITAPGVEPIDACWVRRLALHVSDRYHVELVSVAVGGSKARDVLTDQLPVALGLRPDVVIVSVGANDALRATSLSRFEDEYNQIVAALDATGAGVLLGGIGDLSTIPRLPRMPRAYAKIRGRSYNRAIARVAARYPRARKTITWGPMWEAFSRPDSGVFAPDLFHASAAGHEVFFRAAVGFFEELINGREMPGAGWRGSRGSST